MGGQPQSRVGEITSKFSQFQWPHFHWKIPEVWDQFSWCDPCGVVSFLENIPILCSHKNASIKSHFSWYWLRLKKAWEMFIPMLECIFFHFGWNTPSLCSYLSFSSQGSKLLHVGWSIDDPESGGCAFQGAMKEDERHWRIISLPWITWYSTSRFSCDHLQM